MNTVSFDPSEDLQEAEVENAAAPAPRRTGLVGLVLGPVVLLVAFAALFFWMQWLGLGVWGLAPGMLAGVAASRLYLNWRARSLRKPTSDPAQASCQVTKDLQVLDQKCSSSSIAQSACPRPLRCR